MATKRRKTDPADLEARILAEVEAGKKATSAEAAERAFRVFDLWKRFRAAQETERAERKRTGDNVIACEARVSEALEQDASTGAGKLEILAKARTAWGDLKEAKDERADVLAKCRSERKGLEQQIDELMDEGAQLGLFSPTMREEAAESAARASKVPDHDPETGEVYPETGEVFGDVAAEEDAEEGEADEPFKLGDGEDDSFEPWRPKAAE
jgi:hypothetical protein